MDYVDKLSPKDQEWLDKFAGEYYGASLDFKQRRRNLHNTKRLVKDCTDRNNRQNNDLLGITKITGLLDPNLTAEYRHPAQHSELQEQATIEYIDNKELLLLSEEDLKNHFKMQQLILENVIESDQLLNSEKKSGQRNNSK